MVPSPRPPQQGSSPGACRADATDRPPLSLQPAPRTPALNTNSASPLEGDPPPLHPSDSKQHLQLGRAQRLTLGSRRDQRGGKWGKVWEVLGAHLRLGRPGAGAQGRGQMWMWCPLDAA